MYGYVKNPTRRIGVGWFFIFLNTLFIFIFLNTLFIVEKRTENLAYVGANFSVSQAYQYNTEQPVVVSTRCQRVAIQTFQNTYRPHRCQHVEWKKNADPIYDP